MSVTFVESGDMREDLAPLHIIAVNCKASVMGSGQAKAYADRWRDLPKHHAEAVHAGRLKPGQGHCVWVPDYFPMGGSRGLVGMFLLPTKDDWRRPSRLEWVAEGLGSLVEYVQRANRPGDRMGPIDSIACPSLGCGLGGLSFKQVGPLIEAAAGMIPEVTIRVYEPGAERKVTS